MFEFPKKLIDTITIRNFYLKFKEKNENDMSAQVFWAVFIPADSRAKSAQQLIFTVLPFHPLQFPCALICMMPRHGRTASMTIPLYIVWNVNDGSSLPSRTRTFPEVPVGFPDNQSLTDHTVLCTST